MSKPAAKKAKKSQDAGPDLARAIVENLLCPITSALPVRPVLADDGKVYEREAIERWFESKATSPVTNAEIGTRLVDSGQTRTLVLTVIEGGAVDDDAAAAWHLESAKAMADGKLTGALTSMKDHLDRADALSSSPEIKLSLKAVNLKFEQDALLKQGADAGVDLVASVLGGAKTGEAPMTEWRELRVGKSVIRIIADEDELKRLCQRKPRGSSVIAGWNSQLRSCAGMFYLVDKNGSRTKPHYYVKRLPHERDTGEKDTWAFPYDACILVAY